jgi:hypothetical protein
MKLVLSKALRLVQKDLDRLRDGGDDAHRTTAAAPPE